MKVLILFVYLFCIPVYAVQLYKVIRADGSVVYTDIPSADAKAIVLSSANSAIMPAYQGNMPASHTPAPSGKATISHKLTINYPKEQQTIRNNSGDLSVVASIEPKVSGIVQLFLDGKMLKQQTNLTFELHNIARGEHVISIKLINQSGKIIAFSPDRVFYLHQASALNRPN